MTNEKDFFESEFKTCNIMIAGPSGVGKSTLLNAVFGQGLAETGVGNRVTTKNQWYTLKGKPIQIYDTVGLELGKADELKQNIADDLNKMQNASLDKRIHAVWYCTNSKGDRFLDFECEFVKWLYKRYGLPVFIILTKTLNKKTAQILADNIKSRLAKIDRLCVIPVLAMDDEVDIGDSTIKIPAFGVDKLITDSIDNIPEDYKFALIASQKYDLKQKRDAAKSIINKFGKLNPFTWTFGLIPGANWAEAAISINLMIGKIAKVYNVDYSIRDRDPTEVAAEVTLMGIFSLVPIINVAAKLFLIETIGDSTIDAAEKAFKEIQQKHLEDEYEKARIFLKYLKANLDSKK